MIQRTLQHFLLVALALAAGLSLLGCPNPGANKPPASSSGDVSMPRGETVKPMDDRLGSNTVDYPIPLTERKYTDVHQSVRDAWYLVETAYFVVQQKYADSDKLLKSAVPADLQKGQEMRVEVEREINRNIFGVNDKVDQLFLDAIEAEPDNPLNYASYAMFLKPRKRYTETTEQECEDEALKQIDKAIELWPDESRFYLIKVHILTAPHFAGEFLRTRALEEVAISQRIALVRELLDQALKYNPKNFMIDYYKVLTLLQLTPPPDHEKIRKELVRQIETGNAKTEGYFFFPPPLLLKEPTNSIFSLNGTESEARFYDFWIHFGSYDGPTVDTLVTLIGEKSDWPKEKNDVGAVMLMLYKMGRTTPYDRSFFGFQLKVLDLVQRRLEAKSPEQLKIAETLRYLDSQYVNAMNSLANRGSKLDPRSFNAMGVYELERLNPRQPQYKEAMQGCQVAYLKRAAEILGFQFEFPEDPKNW